MHELAIAQEILAIAAERTGGVQVSRIVVEIGRLCAVVPDALRFCFDLATEGTVAEGARLEIVETPGLARCRACGADVVLERPFGRCACGGTDLEWLAGEELRIREVEIVHGEDAGCAERVVAPTA
jgi:hydrogenase nickel incorporation protein HypA/HybF